MSADKLTEILARAKHAARLAAEAQVKARLPSAAQTVAEDYAHRLAEKARFRSLLADERLDGERFRWYFTHIENSQSLDELRKWIDGKISRASRGGSAS